MSYRIARGEQGVLTFEPYKSLLLPYWRFKTVPIARASLAALMSAFRSYVARGDFVGADMARKFVQMGMTRARRYANHKGGRKWDKSEREVEKERKERGGEKQGGIVGGKGERKELPKSRGHEGMEEKAEASEVFKRGWERCRADEGYGELKKQFQKEQKEWDKAVREGKTKVDGDGDGDVKKEIAAVKDEEDEMKVKEESEEG
jgi:hypothetical protein